MAYMKNGQWIEHGDPSDLERSDVFEQFTSLERNRFHLYVSYGCPFAHRAILAVSLLELQDYVSISTVSPLKDDYSWEFDKDYPDPVNAKQYLYQVYQDAKADYSGRVSVPVLWDKKLNTIVSNDSYAITKWLSEQGKRLGRRDLMPNKEIESIEEQCAWINEHINTLVFKAGFAQEQAVYEAATAAFFNNLSVLENRFKNRRNFYNGEFITLPDLLLIPTLVQLELVYSTHFKLNVKRLCDYPNLYSYVVDMMSYKEIGSTFHTDFIKKTYFAGQPQLNPSKIISIGPTPIWEQRENKIILSMNKEVGEV